MREISLPAINATESIGRRPIWRITRISVTPRELLMTLHVLIVRGCTLYLIPLRGTSRAAGKRSTSELWCFMWVQKSSNVVLLCMDIFSGTMRTSSRIAVLLRDVTKQQATHQIGWRMGFQGGEILISTWRNIRCWGWKWSPESREVSELMFILCLYKDWLHSI